MPRLGPATWRFSSGRHPWPNPLLPLYDRMVVRGVSWSLTARLLSGRQLDAPARPGNNIGPVRLPNATRLVVPSIKIPRDHLLWGVLAVWSADLAEEAEPKAFTEPETSGCRLQDSGVVRSSNSPAQKPRQVIAEACKFFSSPPSMVGFAPATSLGWAMDK